MKRELPMKDFLKNRTPIKPKKPKDDRSTDLKQYLKRKLKNNMKTRDQVRILTTCLQINDKCIT